jgi:hypothetical protein
MRRPHLPGRFQTLSREEQHASLASRSRKICTQVKNPNEPAILPWRGSFTRLKRMIAMLTWTFYDVRL